MSSSNETGCVKVISVLAGIATIIGVIIAILTWVMPFNPIGSSPFASHPTEQPIYRQSVNTVIPTLIPIIIPIPTKIAINNLSSLEVLSLFEIPRTTRKSDIDRLDTVFRPDRSSFLIVIPNYPLLPQYTLDQYGYLYENGQPLNFPYNQGLGSVLNIDIGKWNNYLGVFNFVIPTDKNLQFCGLYIRSEDGGLNWQSSQRFIYSADVLNGFEIERASYVEIQDCSDIPNNDWAEEHAQSAAASSTTDSIYYWDKLSSNWVRLK